MSHRTIIVATDLSPRCDRPFDRALILAQEWKAKLILLHIADPGKGEDSARRLRDIEEKIARDLPETSVDIEVRVKSGDIAGTIIETAEAEKCDLIVTGVARYNSIGDILLGGPVDQLIRNASVPVLIVKRRPRQSYRNLLIATDFSDCSMQALLTAADLFPEPRLHLVHAYHDPYGAWLGSDQVADDMKSDEQKELARFLAKQAISDSVFDRLNASIDKGDLSTVLYRKIEATQSDLIVLGTHGRSALARAALGSNAQHVLGWAEQDVLMVRDRK